MNERKPEYFTESIGIDDNDFSLDLLKLLISQCPNFSNPLQYLPEKFHEKFLPKLKEIQPAEKVPSFFELRTKHGENHLELLLAKIFSFQENEKKFPDIPQHLISKLDSTVNLLFEKLGQHSEDQQRELLDDAEKAIIKSLSSLRMKVIRNEEEEESNYREQTGVLVSLTQLHEEKRSKKAIRHEERIKTLEESKLLNQIKDESIQNSLQIQIDHHLADIKLHNDTIQQFVKLYRGISSYPKLLLDQELCQVQRQIEILYNVSVTITMSGLISVGKSTVVNCLVGSIISPTRCETMTLIPTRYVHDSTISTPFMLVPFHTELNQVIHKLKEILKTVRDEVVKENLGKFHLKVLIDKISNGLIFQPKYEGHEKILQATIDIHDMYRLAIEDVFGNELAKYLPLKWGANFDSFLTVYLSFPEFSTPPGIVNFSIIDTPGIDELGTKKLKFLDVIRNSMEMSNYAALIFNTGNYNSVALGPLKRLFHKASTKYKVPCIAIGTHSETIKTTEIDQFKQNFSESSKYKENIVFPVGNVYLVSSNRKLVATKMLQWLDHNKKKPKLDSENQEESKIAVDWTLSVGYGDDEESRRNYYKDLSVEGLIARCGKLIKTSNMNQPIQRMTEEAIQDAIPLCVKTSIERIRKIILELKEKLKSDLRDVNFEALAEAESKIKKDRDELKSAQKKLCTCLNEKKKELEDELKRQQQEIIKEMKKLEQNSLLKNQSSGEFLDSYFARYIQSFPNSIHEAAAEQLFYQSKSVEFLSQEELSQTVLSIKKALKDSIEDYFETTNHQMIKKLTDWGDKEKESIQKIMGEIANTYSKALDIKIDQNALNSLVVVFGEELKIPKRRLTVRGKSSLARRNSRKFSVDDEGEEEIELAKSSDFSIGFDQTFQSSEKKKKSQDITQNFNKRTLKPLERLPSIPNTLSITPTKMKSILVEYAEIVTNEALANLTPLLDGACNQVKRNYVRNIEKELKKLQDIVDDRKKESQKRRQQLKQDREHLHDFLERFLNEEIKKD